jgi:hypothetical protein
MMRRDHQANDQKNRGGRKYQDYRQNVLKDPFLARDPLPLLQRNPPVGRTIAGGRIVQEESPASPESTASSRAANPNHRASCRALLAV